MQKAPANPCLEGRADHQAGQAPLQLLKQRTRIALRQGPVHAPARPVGAIELRALPQGFIEGHWNALRQGP